MIKIPKKIKMGLKIFGICMGILLASNVVNASIRGDLPVSKISDEFPESYQSYIDKLKQIYPNATFKAVYTGLDWNTVLKHECYEVKKGISLVPSSYSAVWKKDGKNIYMDGSFVVASKSAVAYVLDPRNSLYEKTIFQFEGLSYNQNITTEVVEKVIASSPMVGAYAKKYKNAGQWIDMDMSYAEIINKVGQEQGVSSVYIASRMIQETSGDIVNNRSINGSNESYPGIYNFFNIGATPNADGTGAVLNGLKYAKSEGWTTPYSAISGGVNEIKSSYIKYGQDTVYFQKFDVNNPYGNATALMAYQYQTNIMAPTSESLISHRAYNKLGMLDTAFTFYIPVYNNMLQDPAPYPAGDDAKFVADNTKVYLDDGINNGEDVFNIRSSASSELNNIIYTIKENKNGPDDRTILTRTKKGEGYDWDYVILDVDGKKVQGYVWKEYVNEYQYIKVESIELDKCEYTIEQGETFELVANIYPLDAKFKEVSWMVQDENIATVDNGKINAKNVGTTIVTATTIDGEKTAKCKVTVKEKTREIILDKQEYIIEVDEQTRPLITLKNIQGYELEIADETIASVIDGAIQGITPGETILRVKAVDNELVKEAKVTVIAKTCDIILDKQEYIIEVDEQVKPEITLKNIEGYEIKIADETIAIMVDNAIKGLKQGETQLEIKGTGTDIIKIVKIIVKDKPSIIESYKLHESINVNETKNISNISPKTNANDLYSKIECNNLTLIIKDVNDKDITEESFVGTGTTLTFLRADDTVFDKLTVIIRGDVTGDGVINSADLLKTVKYLKGTSQLNLIAADVTQDGEVNSADLLKTVKYLKGTSTIDFK